MPAGMRLLFYFVQVKKTFIPNDQKWLFIIFYKIFIIFIFYDIKIKIFIIIVILDILHKISYGF